MVKTSELNDVFQDLRLKGNEYRMVNAEVFSIAISIVIAALLFLLPFHFDFLSLRGVNRIEVYSATTNEQIDLIDLIRDEGKERLIDVNYADIISEKEYIVTGTVRMEKIEQLENGTWIITTRDIVKKSSMSITVDDIPNVNRYSAGDKITITGKIANIRTDSESEKQTIYINGGTII